MSQTLVPQQLTMTHTSTYTHTHIRLHAQEHTLAARKTHTHTHTMSTHSTQSMDMHSKSIDLGGYFSFSAKMTKGYLEITICDRFQWMNVWFAIICLLCMHSISCNTKAFPLQLSDSRQEVVSFTFPVGEGCLVITSGGEPSWLKTQTASAEMSPQRELSTQKQRYSMDFI